MIECMRITIRLDDELHAAAKALAVQSGLTLGSVIEDALHESFARGKLSAGTRVQLPLVPARPETPGSG